MSRKFRLSVARIATTLAAAAFDAALAATAALVAAAAAAATVALAAAVLRVRMFGPSVVLLLSIRLRSRRMLRLQCVGMLVSR